MFDRIDKGLWWDKAWSLVSGCTPVSPACDNCWAAAQTAMRANHPNDKVRGRAEGLTTNGHFNGRIRLNYEFLDKPLRTKKPTAWAVWNDLFHEDVPFDFITRAFDVMCSWRWPNKAAQREGDGFKLEDPGHIFIVLTKRPERIQPWLAWVGEHWPGDSPLNVNLEVSGHFGENVWMGVTAENQQTADERIPILLQTPAAVRFVSVEPMLGPVDLTDICIAKTAESSEYFNALDLEEWTEEEAKEAFGNKYLPPLDWVICGGESGPNARPMHPDWARGLQSQCQDAGVPFFFKQWGEWAPAYYGAQTWEPTGSTPYHYFTSPESRLYKVWRVGKKAAGRLLDGQEWLEIPEVERC